MIRQMHQYQTAEELEIMMASAPPTTVGNDRGARDQIPMNAQPLVLSRSYSEAERLLLIRTLQGYNKTTNSRPRPSEQDDDDDNKSAQSVRSSKSWWRGGGGRSARVDDDVKSGIPEQYARSSSSVGGQRQRSLRWKRKKTTPRKPSHDQLVVDFSDIKSFASEPEFVGSKKLQLNSRRKTTKLLDHYETRSVSSSPRKPSNKQLVVDFSDIKSFASEPEFVGSKKLQLYSRGKTTKSTDHHETRSVSSSRSLKSFSLYFQQASRNNNGMDDDDDDEVTMASGLADDFVADDGCSVVSGITLEPPNFQHRAVSEGANLASSPKRRSSKKPSFLRRFYRKIRRSRDTSTSHPTPAATTRQTTTEIPVDQEEEIVLATTAPPASVERFDTANARAPRADRWSPIPQCDDVIAPQAPKRPLRRVDSNRNFQPILEEESKEDDDCGEDDEDEDDDSVISLLSGLLATWTSERNAQQQVQQQRTGAAPSREDPKSCLKTSPLPFGMNGNHPAFKPRFSVSFDRIKIREYERTLGDNPSCTSGPPISIGWTYLHSYDFPIDEYERNKTVRSKREFRLPAGHRADLLTQEWQCPEDDIRKACREATYVQYCREKAVLSRARQREREREAAAMRSNRGGPRPDTSDTAQPPPAQFRHRSSVEIALETSNRRG
jgi:hypothetical protein